MSNTYAWAVNSMTAYPEAEGEQNVVFQIAWVLSATDGAYNAAAYGSVDTTYVAGSPFTPYDQLTIDQVNGWVADALGPEGLAKAQADATEAKAEAQRLRKIVDEAVPAIEELRKQVQVLKKQPGPPAHRGVVVGKEQDTGAARTTTGVDELTAALQKMTPEERATLAIKVSQASPISAMNRGERT